MERNAPMTIDVLLFGPAAQAAKTNRLPVPVPDQPIAIADLRTRLAQAAPALQTFLSASRFAVNHALVDDQHTVTSADEVALIAMVSGG